jgi:hypothetical protein
MATEARIKTLIVLEMILGRKIDRNPRIASVTNEARN